MRPDYIESVGFKQVTWLASPVDVLEAAAAERQDPELHELQFSASLQNLVEAPTLLDYQQVGYICRDTKLLEYGTAWPD